MLSPLVLSALATSPSLPASLDALVLDRLGAVRWSLEVLDVPDAADAHALTVPHDGRLRTLQLERHSLRAPDARVRAWRPDGTYDELALPAPRTFRGTLGGDAAASVVASLGPHGLSARIVSPNEPDWSVVPLATLDPRAPRGAHVVFEEELGRPLPAPCGQTASLAGSLDAGPGGTHPFSFRAELGCQRLYEIAFDADFEYFQGQGSSVGNVVARVDEMMNEVDFFYARDVRVTFVLTDYVVRTAPFYTPTGGGDLLDLFRAEWNTNQAGVVRDLAHLMTGKPGSLIEFGGLAWVGVTCNLGLAYGWSMDGANIVGHEVGHNFGAGHCHDESPCNNMCGACHYIAPVTKGIIEAYVDSKNCHETVGPHATPLPPYVAPEGLALRKDDLATLGTVALDVTRNDHDGNCTPVALASVTSPTPQGGTATVSKGTGPKGRDELLYTPPAEVFVGTDSIDYAVAGAWAPVLPTEASSLPIEVRPLELAAYWNLDEGSGTTAADLGATGSDGAFAGTPAWAAGAYGTALEFDGVDDSVVAPALHLDTDEATVTAWVRRDGPQTTFAGIVFHRGEASMGGLRMASGGLLGYQWGPSIDTWGWNPGLSLPNGQWVFVALVVQPDEARLHVFDGALQTAVNVVDHPPQAWDADVHLASDPGTAFQHFRGGIDDVRIYDHALTDAQILELAVSGGRAEIPSPSDGGLLPQADWPLTWLAGLDAQSHDVYFGSSYAAVEAVGLGSPEFQGNQPGASFAPPAPTPGATWYWRVDEHYQSGVFPGQVWQFRLADYDHWPLDETSGFVADNATGAPDGVYVGGAVLGEPGATPASGTSVRFDGANDAVSIGPLNLNSDRVTITTWLRRDGSQSAFSGLIFSRSGGTVAGLNFGDANELRYHWNNSGSTWGWNSGLVVPDDTWTFAALVVEPTRATMYMSVGGSLVSAVNDVAHGTEEFDGATFLGQDPTGGRWFDGWLDAVRIYDAALTGAQVQALFEAGE